MNKGKKILSITGTVVVAIVMVSCGGTEQPADGVKVDPDDIGGVVSSTTGPEAGVWVIAETNDLPSKFVKIVVTDDQGRYLLPDLPNAEYGVWVRGYGLVDSPKVKAIPGAALNLTAVVAPSPRAAAEYYPANYWYSLIEVPAGSEFPGTGDKGSIAATMTSQAQWIGHTNMNGCLMCHQMGNKATREFPEGLGRLPSSRHTWERRLQSGQAGGAMIFALTQFGRERALTMFADWTDRVAAGELPPAPPRPQGVERNVVITAWDYADAKKYVHDGTSTYKSHPTVNANGPFIAGPEASSDNLWILDPKTHMTSEVKIPVRNPATPSAASTPNLQASPYWGDEVLWTGQSQPHSTMWDAQGRLWATSFVRPPANAAWCKRGSNHPSARAFPLERGGRGASVYDPKTKQVTLIDTCFNTHHLMFGDAKFANGKYADWLFFNPLNFQVLGWIDTKMFDETGDEQKSQGWTPLIVDANGNGRRDAWVEPAAPDAPSGREEGLQSGEAVPAAVDSSKDRRLAVTFYSVVQSPVDGAVWGSVWAFPGSIVRIDLGSNPPETALAEVYDAPWGYPGLKGQGHSPRGIDVDRNGVVWTNLAGSGHLASFDRKRCTAPLRGPTATGKHCPEGWTVYPVPGPNFKGVTIPGNADGLYLVFVDQFNTFGLGENVPFVTGSNSDSLLGLVDGMFVTLRMPYPLGLYTKGMDGRIDDPSGGWKERGLWTTHGNRTPWHVEGGKGRRPQVVHFQLRPNPLAR